MDNENKIIDINARLDISNYELENVKNKEDFAKWVRQRLCGYMCDVIFKEFDSLPIKVEQISDTELNSKVYLSRFVMIDEDELARLKKCEFYYEAMSRTIKGFEE